MLKSFKCLLTEYKLEWEFLLTKRFSIRRRCVKRKSIKRDDRCLRRVPSYVCYISIGNHWLDGSRAAAAT